ncbi:MAG: SGNH/GDSL hydrolase family protein [Planctomycetota bacterium]|nr:SGNH/GDSL hydrolase family protein [Planctomycetota bacterium]
MLSIRYVLFAVLAIALLLSAVEVGLQLSDSAMSTSGSQSSQQSLTSPSWTTHHSLQPSRQIETRNPDTTEPVLVQTNSFGLRGPELAVPKPANVYRVVLLGDETIFGPGVPEQSTIAALLPRYLRPQAGKKLEVINAGTPGFCPLLSYLQTKHTLLAFEPDLIVVHFDMSDVADDYHYRRHTRLTQTSDPTLCSHPDLLGGNSTAKHPWERLQLVQWTRKKMMGRWTSQRPESGKDIDAPEGRYAWLEDNPPDWSVYVAQAFSPLEHFKTLVDGTRTDLVVCTSPSPWQVSTTASDAPGIREQYGIPAGTRFSSRRPFEVLGEFTTKHRILFCDLSAAFQRDQNPDRLFFRNAPHLTSAGHELCARELARFLGPLVSSPPQGPMRRGA